MNMIDIEALLNAMDTIYPKSLIARWRHGDNAIHLALMQGDFLELIIEGEKSIESRFTRARIAPVGNIETGDLVIFKQVGAARMATGIVQKAKTGELNEQVWNFVRKHADDIGIDEDYIEYKSDSRYYALVWVESVHVIEPIPINKRDRRAWVIVSARRGGPPGPPPSASRSSSSS